MTTLTLPTMNGSSAVVPAPTWLQSSVQKFFSGVNWEDHPPEIQEIKLSSGENSAAELSLTLSVDQFFSAINWEDVAIAAPVLQTQSAPAADAIDELTLEDFSSLF